MCSLHDGMHLYNKSPCYISLLATNHFLRAANDTTANDTTEPNTPGNLDLLWLLMIILCLVVAIIVAIVVAIIVAIKCKKKAEQSNMSGEPPTGKERCIDFV